MVYDFSISITCHRNFKTIANYILKEHVEVSQDCFLNIYIYPNLYFETPDYEQNLEIAKITQLQSPGFYVQQFQRLKLIYFNTL